jgi:hypothetical protein
LLRKVILKITPQTPSSAYILCMITDVIMRKIEGRGRGFEDPQVYQNPLLSVRHWAWRSSVSRSTFRSTSRTSSAGTKCPQAMHSQKRSIWRQVRYST